MEAIALVLIGTAALVYGNRRKIRARVRRELGGFGERVVFGSWPVVGVQALVLYADPTMAASTVVVLSVLGMLTVSAVTSR